MEDQKLNIIQIVFGTICLILLFACFIVFILNFYERKRFLFTKEIEDMKSSFEKSLLESKLEIQEEAFQHISREIHDNISHNLALSKLNLNSLNHLKRSQDRRNLNSSIYLIGDVIQSLRNLSKSLHTDIIKEIGLFHALENEVLIIRKTGRFRVCYIVSGEPFYMHPDKSLILFRIIQECLTNIIKHSDASEITLELQFGENNLVVMIMDNGDGFDLQHRITDNASCGLRNLRQRAKLLSADLNLKSGKGDGTVVKITIPFTNQ